MQYFFPDFDENIRTIMYQELLDDIESNNFFKPSSMLDSVVNCYQTILKETFLNQNFEYLSKTLNSCFFKTFTTTGRKVSSNIAQMVAFNDFNRYYSRALLVLALAENKSLLVYRAKQSLNERVESRRAINRIISNSYEQKELLYLLRNSQLLFSQKNRHSLFQPNSGLSLRFL